jgi:hypothetical protein
MNLEKKMFMANSQILSFVSRGKESPRTLLLGYPVSQPWFKPLSTEYELQILTGTHSVLRVIAAEELFVNVQLWTKFLSSLYCRLLRECLRNSCCAWGVSLRFRLWSMFCEHTTKRVAVLATTCVQAQGGMECHSKRFGFDLGVQVCELHAGSLWPLPSNWH